MLTLFLRTLIERGLDLSQGVLVILDGAKGLRSAVRKAFRTRALVQRCQWHKRRERRELPGHARAGRVASAPPARVHPSGL